jgi:hypothetical protein
MKTKPKLTTFFKHLPFSVLCIAAATSLLGTLASSAQTIRFVFTGSQTNIILNPGTYDITAYGAQGGNGGYSGGLGAEMEGKFNFAMVTTLTLLVGGSGGGGGAFNVGAGGGGGSFIVNETTPLVIAGGGGGGGDSADSSSGSGYNGNTASNGGNAGGNWDPGSGGYNGSGGSGGAGYYSGYGASGYIYYGGGGGGGYNGNGGGGGFSGIGGSGGNSYLTGAVGGSGYQAGGGGYGCGGGGSGGGGGGGGYSGGGGGSGANYNDGLSGGFGGGGGGGSIIDSSAMADLTEVSGIASPDDSPNGEVIITALQVQPTAPLLLISHSDNTVTICWENVLGWSLLENTNAASRTGWMPSSGIITTNGTNYLNIANPAGNLFFRLAY